VTGASIRIDVTGDDVLERELAALIRAGEDLAPFMDALGLELEVNTLDRFDREADPQGKAWTPSARASAEGGKTLTDSARLKASIGYRASANELMVGTNVVYGATHQFGFSGAQKVAAHKRRLTSAFGRRLKTPVEAIIPEFTRQMEMPVRAFLGFGPEDANSADDVFRDFFGRAAPQMAGTAA
jgi:phage virion morphogenesis protein